MSDKHEIDEVTGIDTTGHDWDGIKELNNPLPRWWLWCFYLTVIWGIGYTIAYPAWPLINSATEGFLGYSTRSIVAEDIARVEQQNAEVSGRLAQADLSSLDRSDPAYTFGVAGGEAVFRSHCSQCHGSGGEGAKGYPSLLEDDWLWGGTLADIEFSVRHGIRNDTDEDARYSEMPAFGEFMEEAEIVAVTEYVLKLGQQDHDATLASAGEVVFADNCADCHGETGAGDRDLGAPVLNDQIWLYGSDREDVQESIVNARFGVMPAWGPRLKEAEIKAVTLYVHQLGGGE